MQTIYLAIANYKSTQCITLHFDNITALNNCVRKIKGVRWSSSLKAWRMPCQREAVSQLAQVVEGIALLDTTALKQQLTAIQQLRQKAYTSKPATIPVNKAIGIKKEFLPVTQLTDNNRAALGQLVDLLKLKAYSASTIRTYKNEFGIFLQTIQKRDAQSITVEELKRYLLHCLEKLKLTENSIHSRLNALKFYFEQVLGREKFFWEIPRPKKHLQLPKLLNEDEIRRLFNALTNKKHKAMLFTAYSAGLRVSEIVQLKIADIDSKRMQIFIARAKGKKDRYVNLSPVVLDILRNYFATYKPAPRVYLFESEQSLGPYPIRTVQQVFTNAKIKAGIKKEVGVHSLRHSFATHLLDKGTDIKYIKDLLGHFDIRTTERYLHVSKKQLINIVSPFDDLWKSEQIDW